VFGELLLTAGVIVLVYVAWLLWVGDLIYGAERNTHGSELLQSWEQNAALPAATPTSTSPEPADAEPPIQPVLLPKPADAEEFAVMRVPRWGPEYMVPVAGGVSTERTLDTIGIGHYPGTAMPDQPGNFAVAAHRTTKGAPFNRIAELHVGDEIVIETDAGSYTYLFRNLDYIRPDETDVLLPVPKAMDAPAGTAYITMTSCSPKLAMTERIVAYGVFESFAPRA
jgi:sortase A